MFDRGVCLIFKNENALILKTKSRVKPRKIKIEHEQAFRLFPEKKNQQDLYQSTHYVHFS